MTAGVDFEALGDRKAQGLFGEVLGVLEGAGPREQLWRSGTV